MPKRRLLLSSARRSSSRKRKRARRRPRRLPRRSAITRPIRMFPKTSLVELTYCELVNLNVQTGAPYVFNLNSLHDPNRTGVGHQPRGFDQWNTMYNKYCVIGAQAVVEPMYHTFNQSCTIFGFVDDDLDADLYTIEELKELRMPHSRYKYITMQGDSNAPTTKWSTLKYKVGMKKFFGLSKKTQMFKPGAVGTGDIDETSTLNDDQYASLMTTNPVRQCYLKLLSRGAQTDSGLIQVRVTIKYMAVLYDPKEIGSS